MPPPRRWHEPTIAIGYRSHGGARFSGVPIWCLYQKCLDLPLGAAVDALRHSSSFPMFEERTLFVDRIEASASHRGALRMLNRVLNGGLAIGVAYTRRVGHDA